MEMFETVIGNEQISVIFFVCMVQDINSDQCMKNIT